MVMPRGQATLPLLVAPSAAAVPNDRHPFFTPALQLFVDKLRWCTYVVFTELLMLGQCMPGRAAALEREGPPSCQLAGCVLKPGMLLGVPFFALPPAPNRRVLITSGSVW